MLARASFTFRSRFLARARRSAFGDVFFIDMRVILAGRQIFRRKCRRAGDGACHGSIIIEPHRKYICRARRHYGAYYVNFYARARQI